MEKKKYTFGGALIVGGTLDNGNAWKGIRVMCAEDTPGKMPVKVTVFKAKYTEELWNAIRNVPQYSQVTLDFDVYGDTVRLVGINPVG